MRHRILPLIAMLASLSAPAFADNQNWYCGKGSDQYSVDAADLSLVITDGKGVLYAMDPSLGKASKQPYKISKSGGNYFAAPKSSSPNSGYASFVFSACKDNQTASVETIGNSMAPPVPAVACTCEME